MRKILLVVAVLLLVSDSAKAQFYCRAGFGYAVAQAGQSIAGQEWPYSGFTNNGVLYKIDDASFSAGWQGYLSLGCMVNKHIGIQLDAGIGLSTQKLKFTYYDLIGAYLNGYAIVEQRAKQPINLIPSFVVKTGSDPWDVYCRMGIACLCIQR